MGLLFFFSKQNEEKQDQAPPASSNKNVDSTPSNAESDGDKPSKEETATEKPSNTSNNKEKTPMCLINELSFHNKVRTIVTAVLSHPTRICKYENWMKSVT